MTSDIEWRCEVKKCRVRRVETSQYRPLSRRQLGSRVALARVGTRWSNQELRSERRARRTRSVVRLAGDPLPQLPSEVGYYLPENGGDLNDVAKQLSDAWDAVKEAGIPEHLHEVAFRKALLLAGAPGGGVLQRVPSTAVRDDSGTRSGQGRPPHAEGDGSDTQMDASPVGGGSAENENELFTRLTEESGVDEESLRRVFVFRDGDLKLSLSKSKLGKSEAERNRSVGLLVAACRYYLRGTVATPISEIREIASKVPYEVSRNFASHMDGVEGTVSAGSRNDKSIRVQGARIDEAFRALMKRVLGEADE